MGTVGANHLTSSKAHNSWFLGVNVKSNRELDAARRGLPSTADDGKTTNGKIKYHPWFFQLVPAPTQETDSKPTRLSISRQRDFTRLKQITEAIDMSAVYEDDSMTAPILVIPDRKQNLPTGTVPAAVPDRKASHVQVKSAPHVP